MGCRHVLPAAAVFWKYSPALLPYLSTSSPEFIFEHEAQIRQCFNLLSDEPSRQELCNQIQYRYWLDPEFLPLTESAHDLYFPACLAPLNEQDVIADCGAFDGDTIRGLLSRGLRFRHLYALEPDPGNRQVLEEYLANLPVDVAARITVLPFAAGDRDGAVGFAANGEVGSRVISSGEGLQVDCRRIDNLPLPLAPTYIKMDIEGSEPQALLGATRLMQSEMPVLAICLYHRPEHLWQIPILIRSIQPAYSLFIRRYAEDNWEMVCYAIPKERLLSQPNASV